MFILFLLFQSVIAFDCLNENGNNVDFWIIMKKPKGNNYFYYDVNNKNFDISPISLNDTSNGALTHTINQLWITNYNNYNNTNNYCNYVIYNDQIPKQYKINDIDKLINYGHTKGFFAFDENNNGFFITHSIPLFPIGPKTTNKYLGLGSNAWTYAQNMLCLSVKADTINKLSYKFLLNRPQIYETNLNTNKYEYINELVNGKYSTEKICDYDIFTTQNGLKFKLFAKSAEWNNELYSECVVPNEKDTLWVESWIRGSAEGPICPISNYDTLDIKYLDFGNNNNWSETQDHSKWAITINKNIICMGDINRMTSQYSRGGGTTCFNDEILNSILKNAITETNKCN